MQQVFQTQSKGRWKKFKWSSRILAVLFFLCLLVILVAFKQAYQPNIPKLSETSRVGKNVILNKKVAKESKLIERYQGFRKFIENKNKHLKSTSKIVSAGINNQFKAPIRAAFYVAWDAQSYFSLRRSIKSINTILPEWFFINPKGELTTNIDKRGYNFIRASKVKILPILSNNFHEKFSPEGVHLILHDAKKQQKFINDLLILIKKNKFDGINIDFEELSEITDEPLINFQKNLYQTFHKNGLLVTQDVSPFNEDYNYEALNKFNDYLFLMAYDEHASDSAPGSISGQKWIEAAVNEVTKKIPSEKIVLCIAGYGYDWSSGTETKDVTYQEALSTARATKSKIEFDNDTYNLHYDYIDGQNIAHHVEFTDAATNFNTIRFAVEDELAGTAIWRLGSEDNRIWQFYNQDLSLEGLKNFDFKKFEQVRSSTDVDYIGEGEILDVFSNPDTGKIIPSVDKGEMIITEENYVKLPSMYVVKKWGKPLTKKMVLTFDDGPDPTYTPQILDTLAKYHVPASFFVVGIQSEENIPIIKRIYREGHELGNHTFTHPNMAEVSKERSKIEMDATRLLIECITGHSTILFRAPFNADSEPETLQELIPVADSRVRNYLTVGESIDPEDWEAGELKNFTADSIVNRVIRQQAKGNIILLHDAGGPREATVAALPKIIKYFRNKGYTFTTVADLLGKKKDEVMPPIPKTKGYYIYQVTNAIAVFGYYFGHLFSSMFFVFIGLGVLRFFWLIISSILVWKREKKSPRKNLTEFPLVSIIVPAYNEEVNAMKSLQNLLLCDYPNFNIIFVNDGSKDATLKVVSETFGTHQKIKILDKINGGKASALNYGISRTDAEFLVCIDADTQLKKDAVRILMENMMASTPEKVGAVAGNVKVGNEVNLLTKWQSLEYISSQNFDRRAFSMFNAITVVPGAIGLFRKKVLQEVGGFSTDTLAEDCDLTIKILKLGYEVKNENNAIAITEVPETLKQFMKQRFRWTFGVLQTFWKNKDAFLNKNYKGLGMLALPDMLIFKYVIPFFAPIADLLMIVGLLTGSAEKIATYYLLFLTVDGIASYTALLMENASFDKLIWLIPQRIIYRWLMLIVLFRAFRKALKGELQSWGILKRTGNLKPILE